MLLLDTQIAAAQPPEITDINVYDEGDAGSSSEIALSIDTTQDQCTDGTKQTPEPFFDSVAAITISNPSTTTFRASRLRYELRNLGLRKRYRSPLLAPSGPLEVKSKEQSTVYVPILSIGNGIKVFPRTNSLASDVIGLRTVKFTLTGRLGSRPVTLKAHTTLSFSNFDRCQN